ncbi:MAG: hypothetical protein Q9212_003772 [Teloschistes hypoglaucus]
MLLGRLYPLVILPWQLIQALSIVKPRVDEAIGQPNNVNVQARDVPCTDYESCGIKGLKYWNILTTTLANAMSIDRNDFELFEEHYHALYDTTFMADEELLWPMQSRRMDPSKIDHWEVSGIDPDTLRRDAAPAYYNQFDTNQGLIIAAGNWRAEDSQKALPWSEIIYHTWNMAANNANSLVSKNHPPGGPISRLQSVVQHIVTNKVTQTVLKAAYEANGWVPGYDGPDEWRKWTEIDTGPFFFGLLGTDNVKGSVWLLNDHAKEIGRKDISAIWSRWHMGNPDLWCVNGSVMIRRRRSGTARKYIHRSIQDLDALLLTQKA